MLKLIEFITRYKKLYILYIILISCTKYAYGAQCNDEIYNFIENDISTSWTYIKNIEIIDKVPDPVEAKVFISSNDSKKIKLEISFCSNYFCATGVALKENNVNIVLYVNYFHKPISEDDKEAYADEGSAYIIINDNNFCWFKNHTEHDLNDVTKATRSVVSALLDIYEKEIKNNK